MIRRLLCWVLGGHIWSRTVYRDGLLIRAIARCERCRVLREVVS